MACATPVLATATVGNSGLVVHGRTGYLLAAADAALLAERLAHLHAHPALARSLGVNGWRHAHRHYTWRSAAHRLLAIYGRMRDGVVAPAAAAQAALAGSPLAKAPTPATPSIAWTTSTFMRVPGDPGPARAAAR